MSGVGGNLTDRPASCCGGCLPGCLTDKLADAVLKGRTEPPRLKNMKTPKDHGMEYKSVNIIASDGIRLSAWEIDQGSQKVAIVNHPLSCTRSGSEKGFDGVPVDFYPMLKHLFNAGFNILTYDHRGQGESDGGVGKNKLGDKECPTGAGAEEWKDFVGALRYVKAHATFSNNQIALMSQCMGANAAIKAWGQAPDEFDLAKIKCQVALQPTLGYNMTARMTRLKIGINLAPKVHDASMRKYGWSFANPLDDIASVKVPVLFAQVKADKYTMDAGTQVNDVQIIHDACITEKTLIWIGPHQSKPFGTGMRFDGYNYFNQHPDELIQFLNKHIA